MSKLKIGVIGAGVLGAYHIAKCRANPNVSLCGFYDKSEHRRLEMTEKFSIPAFSDVASLLEEAEAVIIATPSSSHYAIALMCIGAGKHLLIEKPMSTSFAEGAEMVAAAEKAGLVLHVGHSESFNPAFIKLLSHHPAPRFLEIHRLATYSPRGTDVSVILDLMVHDIQLILRLCGEEPQTSGIAATGVPVISNGIDIANVRLSFPSGCVANLTASRISAKRMRKIRLFAKDNYFSVDLDKGEFDHYYLTENAAAPPGAPPVAFSKETIAPKDALESELQAFVDAVSGISQPEAVTGNEALKILKVTDVILEAIKQVKMS
jgi:predicted dehydrogenase